MLEKLGGSKAAPFPRDAVQEALVLDARDRAAAKKRALVEDVPPPPVFDPFEDNLVRASVLSCSRAVDRLRFYQTRSWVVSFSILSRVGPRRSRRWRHNSRTGRAARPATSRTVTTAETPATSRRPEDLGLPRRGGRC